MYGNYQEEWNNIFQEIRDKMSEDGWYKSCLVAERVARNLWIGGHPPVNICFMDSEKEVRMNYFHQGNKLLELIVGSENLKSKSWDLSGHLRYEQNKKLADELIEDIEEQNRKKMRVEVAINMSNDGSELKFDKENNQLEFHFCGPHDLVHDLVSTVNLDTEVYKVKEKESAISLHDSEAYDLLEYLYGFPMQIEPENIKEMYPENVSDEILNTEIDANVIVDNYKNGRK